MRKRRIKTGLGYSVQTSRSATYLTCHKENLSSLLWPLIDCIDYTIGRVV